MSTFQAAQNRSPTNHSNIKENGLWDIFFTCGALKGQRGALHFTKAAHPLGSALPAPAFKDHPRQSGSGSRRWLHVALRIPLFSGLIKVTFKVLIKELIKTWKTTF
jgi:hypothetical protein